MMQRKYIIALIILVVIYWIYVTCSENYTDCSQFDSSVDLCNEVHGDFCHYCTMSAKCIRNNDLCENQKLPRTIAQYNRNMKPYRNLYVYPDD